jgi:hypothetical protein
VAFLALTSMRTFGSAGGDSGAQTTGTEAVEQAQQAVDALNQRYEGTEQD